MYSLMSICLFVFIVYVLLTFTEGTSIGAKTESLLQCSTFHYEEHVMHKLVKMEHQMGLFTDTINTFEKELRAWIRNIEKAKENMEKSHDDERNLLVKERNQMKDFVNDTLEKLNKIVSELINNTNTSLNGTVKMYSDMINNKLNDFTTSFTDAKFQLNQFIENRQRELKDERQRIESRLNNFGDMVTNLTNKVNSNTQNPTTAFTAYLTSSKTLTKYQVLKFDKTWTNIGDAYDTNSGVFTAKQSGLYHFTVVLMSGRSEECFFHIWLNDDAKSGSYTIGDGYKTGTIDIVLDLNVGDRVYVKSKDRTEKIYSDSNYYTTFSGFFI